jgi:NADPH:quinone reductase-like Zn-dependent oxidoreductase/SAM-dependent methyltransferase
VWKEFERAFIILQLCGKKIEAIEKACGTPIAPEKLYNDLRSLGMEYTGPFASLAQARAGPFTSSCRLTIPDTQSDMPGVYQQPHCLHPVTLDLCFQTVFPSLITAGRLREAGVLRSIEELDISGDISTKPGKDLTACAKAMIFGHSNYRAGITVVDTVELEKLPLIEVRGLVLSFPSSSKGAGGASLCHRLEWGTAGSCAKRQDIVELCSLPPPKCSARERMRAYDAFAQFTIQNVLCAISPEVEAAMGTHCKKMVNWMRTRKTRNDFSNQMISKERIQSLAVDGEMLVRVSENLLPILKGEIDPLAVLTREDLLDRFYSSTESMVRCHTQLAEYVRLLGFENPHMKVLEIGAGTAGTTVSVLEALTSQQRPGEMKLDKYVFTDISTAFFEKAKVKLEQWQGTVEFKKLDIEESIEGQGFEAGSFDLVVTFNVLHATRSLAHTLGNVRSLLKPQGKLALIEVTEPRLAWPMIFGTLPGFWLSEDGRTESPFVSLKNWQGLLMQTNFSGIDVEMKDYASADEHQQSVVISTALSQDPRAIKSILLLAEHEEEIAIASYLSDLVSAADQSIDVRKNSLSTLETVEDVFIVLLEAFTPLIVSCTAHLFERVKQMLIRSKNILWVTRGGAINSEEPGMALVAGLARTLRSEDQGVRIVTLDLDPEESSPVEIGQQIWCVFNLAFGSRMTNPSFSEFEYAVRRGKVMISRLVEDSELGTYVQNSVSQYTPKLEPFMQASRSLGLEIATPGLLETFYWADSVTHSRNLDADEVRVDLKAIGLNFKDLMIAMGQLQGLSAMLIECSGTVVEVGENARGQFSIGDRVCSLSLDGFASSSNVNHRLLQRIPDDMPFELAAAIPAAYVTALYALRDVARLQKGESVLIHSAAGALGQAAFAVARYLGAGQIFVTIGNLEKKAFIVDHLGIPEENIFSSRSLSFSQGIMRVTQGRGVDVVLNSLSGDATREGCKALGHFGRFIEVGKKDLLLNTRMETRYLEKNITFAVVDSSLLVERKPSIFQELLRSAIDLVHAKKVQLLHPITVRPISELEDTFRLMQTGKHMGKLVCLMDHTSQVMVNSNPFWRR